MDPLKLRGFTYEPDTGEFPFVNIDGSRFSRKETELYLKTSVAQSGLSWEEIPNRIDRLIADTARLSPITVVRESGEYRVNNGPLRTGEETTQALLREWRKTPRQVEDLLSEADERGDLEPWEVS